MLKMKSWKILVKNLAKAKIKKNNNDKIWLKKNQRGWNYI